MGLLSNIWNKHLGGKSTPWADISYVGKKMKVKAYNKAFVDDLRSRMGDLTTDKTDEEVVKLFYDRENVEMEEPRLEVIHSGITEDGRVKMKLDWNYSFIRHLAEHGITAETEEEAVWSYLAKLVNPSNGNGESREDIDDDFSDLDQMAQIELEEAARQIEAQNASRNRVRGKRVTRRRKSSSGDAQ